MITYVYGPKSYVGYSTHIPELYIEGAYHRCSDAVGRKKNILFNKTPYIFNKIH